MHNMYVRTYVRYPLNNVFVIAVEGCVWLPKLWCGSKGDVFLRTTTRYHDRAVGKCASLSIVQRLRALYHSEPL